MDDFLKLMSNEEDLIQLSSKLLIILTDCGFRFVELNKCTEPFAGKRKFTQNKRIRFDRISSRPSVVGSESRYFHLQSGREKNQNTRRSILSFTSSISDPLGILTPFTLETKLLIQEVCSREIDCDETTPLDFQ